MATLWQLPSRTLTPENASRYLETGTDFECGRSQHETHAVAADHSKEKQVVVQRKRGCALRRSAALSETVFSKKAIGKETRITNVTVRSDQHGCPSHIRGIDHSCCP
jgi:hypothetical protein